MADLSVDLAVPHVLGVLFNWGLHGALSAQVYLYYLAFPDDKTFNQILVYGVYILETVQGVLLVFIGISVYDLPEGIWNWSEQEFLASKQLYEVYWVTIPFLGGLVTLIVQSFYAYRLRILARSWVIVVFIISLAVSQFVVTVVGGSVLSPGPYLQNQNPMFLTSIQNGIGGPSLVAWVTLSIACDVIIASAMTYFLLRSDNGWKSTRSLLVRLVRLAIETGTVTVVVSVTCLVLLTGSHNFLKLNFIYVPISVLGKVYSNAMMANFNQRIQFHNGRNDSQFGTTSFVMPSMALFPDSAGTDAEIEENISMT